MAEDFNLIAQALSLINDGACAEAVTLLDRLLISSPSHHQALFVKGEALRRAGDNAGAAGWLQRALQLIPSANGDIFYRLGLAQMALGELPSAEEALRAAAAAEGSSPASALLSLAELLTRQGRIEEAATAMESVLALGADGEAVADQLLHGLIAQGKYAEAEKLARKMVARFPDHARWHYTLGWLLRALNRFADALEPQRQATLLAPESAEYAAHLGMALRQADRPEEAAAAFEQALALDPNSLNAALGLAGLHLDANRFEQARELVEEFDRRTNFPRGAARSVVIPVLDYSPGSSYNIRTLLEDLRDFDGEVICIFNGEEVFEDLRHHPRIDKYSFNKYNVGVSRAWNMGINQAEGEVIHVLNADLHVEAAMLQRMEHWLQTLPDALCVGVSAHWVDHRSLREVRSLNSGSFSQPMEVDMVSGQIFSLHSRRLHDAGIMFDPRLSPYFGEEADLSIKARRHHLKIYAVPETDFDHAWGISVRDRPILYFGRPVNRTHCMVDNNILLQTKAHLALQEEG